ncbi:MAG: response regulator [Defluviitaleaceae bacterium]|nr:response regulator [Defluviitaleaceae bacterium]
MEKTIFIVDNVHTNLYAVEQALEAHYNVLTMPSGKKAISILEKITPHLILLDIDMPDMNGFEVLQYLKSHEEYRKIPVVFLTGVNDDEAEAKGFEMGIVDFIAKPFSTPILLSRIKRHIDANQSIYDNNYKLDQTMQSRIYILADIAEKRDQSTGGHIERVANCIEILIKAMQERGVYHEEIKDWKPHRMAESSLLHDIGKITITDTILNKPGKLTPEEFEIIKSHTLASAKIINQVIARDGESDFLHHALLFAKYHHERWDGSGYPFGLVGEDIPMQGRIMSLVDVYDALISERLDKEAFSDEHAAEYILEQSGKHFDPRIVEVFNEIRDQFRAVRLAFENALSGSNPN